MSLQCAGVLVTFDTVLWAHVLARAGGDEFLVLVPDCTPESAQRVAERVRASVPAPLGCSAGLVTWDGRESVEDVVKRADSALYAAKASGRGRLVVGSADTLAAGIHRASNSKAVVGARTMRVDAAGDGSYDDLLADAGVVLATADSENFISVSPAFEQVLGWRGDELLARAFPDLIHPADVEAAMRVAASVDQAGDEIKGFECRMRHRDGSYV